MTFVAAGKLVHVAQGTSYVSAHPKATMSTVLGSCISVCLFDLISRVGGMNHFLLPAGQGTESGHIRFGFGFGFGFGVNAMERLINELLKSGASKSGLQAKLFGGARMSAMPSDVGRQNATFAHTFLTNEGIPCRSESIGGTWARRVMFRPSSRRVEQLFVQNDAVAMNDPSASRVQRDDGNVLMFLPATRYRAPPS